MKLNRLFLSLLLLLTAFRVHALDALQVDTNNWLRGRTSLSTTGSITVSNQYGKVSIGSNSVTTSNLFSQQLYAGAARVTNSFTIGSTTFTPVSDPAASFLVLSNNDAGTTLARGWYYPTASGTYTNSNASGYVLFNNLGTWQLENGVDGHLYGVLYYNTTNIIGYYRTGIGTLGEMPGPKFYATTNTGASTTLIISGARLAGDGGGLTNLLAALGQIGVATLIDGGSMAWSNAVDFIAFTDAAALATARTFAATGNVATASYVWGLLTNGLYNSTALSFGIKQVTSLAAGANAAVPLGTNVSVELSGNAGAATLAGLDGQTNRNGDFRIVTYRQPYNLTVAHESGLESIPANRIYSFTGADRVSSGPCAMMFQYDSALARWKLLGFETLDGATVLTTAVSNYFATISTNAATTTVTNAFPLAQKSALAAIAGSYLDYSSFSVGEYGWSFVPTNQFKITALGKYKRNDDNRVLSLQVRRTNVLGRCDVLAQTFVNMAAFSSNQYCYATLPFPITVETNARYSVTFTFSASDTNSGYQVTTLTTPSEISSIYGVAANTDCQGYSGWSGQGFADVNFRYEFQAPPNTFFVEANNTTDPRFVKATVSLPAGVQAHLNLANSYNEKPYDIGRFMKTPFRRMDAFLDYYPGVAPFESLFTNIVIRWKTNGMAAAGWNHLSFNDGWQTRDATLGTLTWGTNVPSGVPYLANYLHTNGFKLGVYTSWTTNAGFGPGSPWWPTVYNVCQFSNDIRNFMKWGVDSLFLDDSVQQSATTIEQIRPIIRIFNDVVLSGDYLYNSTNLNRGMIFTHASGLLGPFSTNQALAYEFAHGVNSITLNGDENNVYAPTGSGGSWVGEPTFYTKVKTAYDFPWLVSPGHFTDAQAIHSAVSSNVFRVLFQSYIMGPLGIIINPGATNVCFNLLTNQLFWNKYYDDSESAIGPVQGYAVGTNTSAVRAEIWRRPINTFGGTNLICFINAGASSATLKFTNTMVGISSGDVAFDDPWTGARLYQTTNGTMDFVAATSNAYTYVTYPMPANDTPTLISAMTWAITGGGFTRVDLNSPSSSLAIPDGVYDNASAANHSAEIPVPSWTTQAICQLQVYVAQASWWTNTFSGWYYPTNSAGQTMRITPTGVNVTPPYFLTNSASAILTWTNTWPQTNVWAKTIRFDSGAKTNTTPTMYFLGPLRAIISPKNP